MAKPKRTPAQAQERFWSLVSRGEGCWEWTAALDTKGYGVFGPSGRGKLVRTHRYAYESWSGSPIPTHLWVLHKCDNRKCVRPDHLYLGTPMDNMRDMMERRRNSSRFAGVTHCIRGHEFTAENTYSYEYVARGGTPGIARQCRTCWTLRREARRNAKRSPAA